MSIRKNGIRYKGKILDVLPFVDRASYIPRLYSDATCMDSISNPAQSFTTIGFGYCVEFPNATMDTGLPAIPAHGYKGDRYDFLKDTTTIELMGVLFALRETGLTGNLEICCDSCNGVRILNLVLRDGAKAKHFTCNLQLRKVITELEEFSGQGMTARWVRGHANNPPNQFADGLAALGRKIYESEDTLQYEERYTRIKRLYQNNSQRLLNS